MLMDEVLVAGELKAVISQYANIFSDESSTVLTMEEALVDSPLDLR